MIPRGILDIGWNDLMFALGTCLLPNQPAQGKNQPAQGKKMPESVAAEAVLTAWDTPSSLVCLSVRSGFDLLLQTLQIPVGSEVLVSAITIPDMIHILEHHGLVAVPVDLEPTTMGIDLAALQRALTAQTKAILVAHLFGSRIDLHTIAVFADQHKLMLWEDCAQAYCGSRFRGDPASDVVMFSFGTIKTHTALGGGILIVGDEQVRLQMVAIQSGYVAQSRWGYLKRVARLSALLTLAPPPIFTMVIKLLQLAGINHDDLFSKVVRGFPGADLIGKIRHRPCAPLLRLLARRLSCADPQSIERRIALAERMIAALPGIERPATEALVHKHWVVPILSRDPDKLIQRLWRAGFDATRRASSMGVVQSHEAVGRQLYATLLELETANSQREAEHIRIQTPKAQQILDQMLYLPIYPYMSDAQIKRMGQVIVEFEAE